MRLKNKVAIVTGGSRDIGRAVSCQLAQEGAKVVINYHSNIANAEETLKLITDQGGEGIIVKGDVTKSAEVAQLVDQARAAFGDEIHILVNVAGGMVARKPTLELDEEFWDAVMDLNLKSAYLVSKATIPHMKSGASIVNLSSLAGRDGGGPGASAYATAKGGIMTYTRSLAKELGPKNIRVNAVLPGMIATTFHDTFSKPEVRVNVANATLLKREGEASEVADLIVYLASDQASYITGTNIDINGGLNFS
ncbi:SDR family NAD(P)-dependent oxidoreductase [Pedobacter nyackensis]|uniref:3-oxoacyl-[acyl-carrier protein] reductase n=1 Tax=Pedobacter nyackensis TaxID=475255 RepID=A0A1W2D8G2_9SPHI|nr:3-oxoacyl-ACP reductase family protein [Pedobacter nyackensis]SMC93807.1 3-oxoacyl-[acyl-carrier protein] reductase [Pedobacter nyackensis]